MVASLHNHKDIVMMLLSKGAQLPQEVIDQVHDAQSSPPLTVRNGANGSFSHVDNMSKLIPNASHQKNPIRPMTVHAHESDILMLSPPDTVRKETDTIMKQMGLENNSDFDEEIKQLAVAQQREVGRPLHTDTGNGSTVSCNYNDIGGNSKLSKETRKLHVLSESTINSSQGSLRLRVTPERRAVMEASILEAEARRALREVQKLKAYETGGLSSATSQLEQLNLSHCLDKSNLTNIFAQRLRAVEKLKSLGLVSDEEYEQKRASILADL